MIDRFEEPRPAPTASARSCGCIARIVVDRDSQKPIVIGKGGDMIKRIGTAAREELERFFGSRVFLDLHVRVKAEWRDDERLLGRDRPSGSRPSNVGSLSCSQVRMPVTS